MSRSRCLVVALALLACVAVHADDIDVHDPDVLKLTKDTFDDTVNNEDLVLVEFYAPWCGHCKHLAPEYAKAATTLKSNDPPVKLAKVDATIENDIARRFDVSGYPTLKIFRKGAVSAYEGPREANGIVNYMKKQAGPPAKPISTPADLAKLKAVDPVNHYIVAGFFQEKISALRTGFRLAAEKLRDKFTFALIVKSDTNEALFTQYGVDTSKEAIILIRDFDGGAKKYEGSSKVADIEEFVWQNSLPAIGEYNQDNAERYERRNMPVLRLFVKPEFAGSGPNQKQTTYYLNRLKKIHDTYSSRVLVAFADPAKYGPLLQEMGLEGRKAPLVMTTGGGAQKYLYDGEFKVEAMLDFVKKVLAGEWDLHVKSEPEPADNNGPVKVVTGKTFNKIVNDPERDVLIEFYAPWCGHCKALTPKYEELGKKFEDVDSVVIAKIDATANDYDRSKFEVSGFPTIFLVPAKKDAKPIKYEGAREVSDFRSFIKKNAAKKIEKKGKKGKKDEL